MRSAFASGMITRARKRDSHMVPACSRLALNDWLLDCLHETSIGLAVKELEEDAEAKEAIGSHGGNRLSVSAERLEVMKRRRWGEMEDALPDMIPRVLDRGSRRIARDVLAILADGPRRPSEMRGMLGIASANYFTARYITPMKESGLIAPVNAASLHSPWQAYRLTPKGRKMLS